MPQKVRYLLPPRYNKRIQKRAIEQSNVLFIKLCKQFRDEFTYTIEGEFIRYDDIDTAHRLGRLDYMWRRQVNRDKELLGDNFTRTLHSFVETCELFMESVADHVYIPVVCRMLEEKYGMHRDQWPGGDEIAGYRKSGLDANAACIEIVLEHYKFKGL